MIRSTTTSNAASPAVISARQYSGHPVAADISLTLRQWFGVELSVSDPDSQQVVYRGQDQLDWQWPLRDSLLQQVDCRGRAEFIEEQGPLLAIALPLVESDGSRLVAWGMFLTKAFDPGSPEFERCAAALEVKPAELQNWAENQTPIAPDTLERLATLVLARRAAERRVVELEQEVENLSDHLCATYEEISLIYRLTHNLTISRRQEELAGLALEWLCEIVPAEGMAIQLLGQYDRDGEKKNSLWMSAGEFPLSEATFIGLTEYLGLNNAIRPVVANRSVTAREGWPEPRIRQLIIVPLSEGERLFGWLIALNHHRQGEFGTVEADLLSSVSAILGIHRGNTELYREQAELLANIVRALTSAIDAKDPYTRGHSDRVARVAVRLAKELGCSQELVDTIYLSGLLHDVGKIGIDDNVLRKPGSLTPEEFEHIKTHAQVGYNILADIKQLGQVLPVVLHHHEAWDGSGYPHSLAGTDIPFLARIVAVADAFDAMGSDRPYRAGMSDDKLDSIIRSGAGKQWDPQVVQAFFAARNDIREIAHQTADPLNMDLATCFSISGRSEN